VTIVTNEFLTGLTEQETIPSGPGTSQVATGSLSSDVDDYDRDGVPNLLDDCPTVYNPPFCTVQDAACPATILCTDVTLTPTACNPADPATLDPTTFQCDTDQNGIGDHCQVLTPPVTSGTCAALDSDFDTKVDYNPNAILKLPNGYDFDRDLVPNLEDNCPTTINGDQADLNNNGIGDACETLTGGQLSDPDLDNVPTFNPLTLALDNCPGIYNPGQEDNDGDGVGNACVITAALDNCTYTINTNQGDKNGDGVGDQCALAPIDLLTVNPGPGPATGTVSVWGGDGSGRFHALASSPLGGALQHPTSAASGHFTLSCTVLPPPIPPICHGKTAFDIAVAEQATPGNLTDDRVTVFDGDGFGAFVAVPPVAVQGDPSQLIVSHDQQLCGNPRDPAHPSLRHDLDGVSDFLAVVEPGTSSIGVLLPSNQNAATPGLSSLVSPTGFPTPLPVPGVLIGAFFTDLNQDGRIDIVALSAPASGPSLITLYIGMGNGLFFTDPTINPDPVPGPISLAAGANIDLKTDSFFPDLVLFDTTDQTPIVLTNVIGERSDTDDSGRVDGRDLAILARAFGATRGEDFTIQPSNGTLLQIGAGASRIVVGGGAFKPGQDIPPVGANCDNLFEPLSGRYGLPADINLDGTVDGKDLAFLAGLFGKAVP
jgi:hypothetical protein